MKEVEVGLIWESETLELKDANKTNSATSESASYDNGGWGRNIMEVWHFESKDASKTNSATPKSFLYDSGGGGRTDMEVWNFEWKDTSKK